MKTNIVLTGVPKSGKSTLLNKLIIEYQDRVGLVTNEIRNQAERTGFEVETSKGSSAVIASIDFLTNFQVSKYFVDIEHLDAVLPGIAKFNPDDLLYLDEIGQMQLPSEKFRQTALDYLNSANICVATLSKVFENDFTKSIRQRSDVILIEVNPKNRSSTEDYARALIRKILKAKRYVSEPERFDIIGDTATITTDHGLRHLKDIRKAPICECDFFAEHGICSHVIALEEYLNQ